jgi:hypothetical protein
MPAGQGELFLTWRYHALFTDSPFILVQAEAQHSGHAIIEQVNADLVDGPLAHLPSGHFAANSAWLTCAVIAYNLTRTAGHFAGATSRPRPRRHHPPTDHQRGGRLAHSARKMTIHLPDRWPWQHSFTNLFTAVHARAAPA